MHGLTPEDIAHERKFVVVTVTRKHELWPQMVFVMRALDNLDLSHHPDHEIKDRLARQVLMDAVAARAFGEVKPNASTEDVLALVKPADLRIYATFCGDQLSGKFEDQSEGGMTISGDEELFFVRRQIWHFNKANPQVPRLSKVHA